MGNNTLCSWRQKKSAMSFKFWTPFPQMQKVPTFIKQTLLNLNHTLIVGVFNTQLSIIDRSLRQKLNCEIMKLTEVIKQMGLRDIYRILHPKTKEYIFFSAPHGTCSKIDHILGQMAWLKRHKNNKCVRSDSPGLKLELNESKHRNPGDSWIPNSSIINDHRVREEIRKS